MSAEEGDVVGQLACELAQPALARRVECVARLDLEMGDPRPERFAPAAAGERAQLFGARLPSLAHTCG